MKNFIIYLSILLISNIYAQCDDYNAFNCNNEDSCEWIENIETGSCENLSASDCELISGCDWEYGCTQWGWWYDWCYTYGYECNGGTYSYDNGYCEEIEMPECNEEYDFQCTDGSCIPIHRVCNNINDCDDGSDEINCEDCSDLLIESNCNYLEECEWIESGINCGNLNTEINCNNYNCDWNEDIETINCSTLPTYGWSQGNCDYYYPDCYEYLDYGGSYGSWSTECGGGIVQIDNSYCNGDASYCQEIIYESGDINQDSVINIQDVIILINLILNGEFISAADLNLDSTVNVLDVIQIVNIILN